MILGGDLDFQKVKGNLKNSICGIDDQAGNLAAYHDSDGGYDGLPGCGPVVRVLAYQTPVAVSSYIMAQQAGADGQLAGQLVVFSSVLSIFTLFVTIFILRTMGLLAV